MATPNGTEPEPLATTRLRNWHCLLILILLTMSAGLLSIRLTHFSTPFADYWQGAQEFAKTSKIASTFTPNFYPALLGEALRVFGRSGPILAQFVIYESFAVAVYFAFRFLGMSARASAFFGFLIAMCPDLITGIQKIWDIGISCLALIALVLCILLLIESGANVVRTILTGVVWGFGIAIRPNFPSLGLLIFYVIWLSLRRDRNIYRNFLLHALLLITVGSGVSAFLYRFSHGAFYWPQNGAYNFFAGANDFTGESLKSHLNAEPSISLALEKLGIQSDVSYLINPKSQKLFIDQGLSFIQSHPWRWSIDYCALKFFTMLRPDTKLNPIFSRKGLARAFVSSALIFWLFMLYLRKRSRWRNFDSITLLLIVVYSIPFLLTNSDPRFGLPLNLILWIGAISGLCDIRKSKASHGMAAQVSRESATSGVGETAHAGKHSDMTNLMILQLRLRL